MPDIFLSYNREDQARAKLFAEAFGAEGFNVWWDAGLKAGEAYDEVTETALRTAKAVVVLWSKKSVVSRWVRAEATLAARNKTLVPCMIEPCERPIMFELTQTAELGHWTGDPGDSAWRSFLGAVRRFIDSRTTPEQTTAPAPGRRTTQATDPIVAVLPFDNFSDDREMQFFSDGVSEEILGRLARSSTLRVIARTSSFHFRGGDKSRAAAALRATHVLDGSVRRANGQIRVAAQLMETANQTTLWSGSFDRGLEDVFAVQDEIAEAIAHVLKTAFLPSAISPIDPEAYDLFLQSRTLSKNRADDWTIHYDRPSLEKVVALAPSYAEGWAALALALCAEMRIASDGPASALGARATEAAMRALALDPSSSTANVAMHFLEPMCGRYEARVEYLQLALASSPNDPGALFEISRCMAQLGRTHEAFGYAARAHSVDPYFPRAASWHALSLFTIGLPEQGFRAFEKAYEKWPRSETVGVVPIYYAACGGNWALVDELTGRLARATFENPFARTILENVQLLREPTPEGIDGAVETGRRQVRETGTLSFAYFAYLCLLGQVNEVYDLIESASFSHLFEPGGQVLPGDFGLHCLFDAYNTALRQDRRFTRLCARLGLVDYWQKTDAWPDCVEDLAPFYDFRTECQKALAGIDLRR